MFIEVFVSYAREDEELAGQIVENLESKGIRVWWDKKIGLEVENYRAEIEKAIMSAQCFLVIWSKFSKASHWVVGEFDQAKKGGGIKPKIIGLFVEDINDAPLGWGSRELSQLQITEEAISKSCLEEITRTISNAIGIRGPNEHIIRPKAVGEDWDIRDLAIETPVPGMDLFVSFRPFGSGGTFLLMRLDTTDGWVDSMIESAEDRHKPFKGIDDAEYHDANRKKRIVKVKNDILFIMDPLRPISIQIGSLRSKRPSADPGIISGDISLDQLEILPLHKEWVSMTLAEILSTAEALQYLWDRVNTHANEWSGQTTRKIRQMIAKNPNAPLDIQSEMCDFCNDQFKRYRRLTSEEIEKKHGAYIIANDFPFGPSFHYLAITEDPVHTWEKLQYKQVKGLNLLIHEFLQKQENVNDAAGIEVGFNSTIRHLILGKNTRSSAGASISHIHKQVWGMAPHTTNLADRLIEISQAYWNNNIDYQESYYYALKESGYVVWEDDHIALYVPYGQSSKHELQAMTLEPRANFIELTASEVESLSKAEYIALRIFKHLKINSFNQVTLTKMLKDPRAPRFRFVETFITREIDLAVSELSMLYVVDQHPWDSRNEITQAWETIKGEVLGEFKDADSIHN